MFALKHDTDWAFYTNNYTWNKYPDQEHATTLTFETYEQAESFAKTMFSDYQRKNIDIVDISNPTTIKKTQLPVVNKFIIAHTGNGKFYGKMFSWTTQLDYAVKFDTEEDARQTIRDVLSQNTPWDLLEIHQIAVNNPKEEPLEINNLTTGVITSKGSAVNANVEIYRAAIALIASTKFSEEEAIAVAERVWLKVKHDRQET